MLKISANDLADTIRKSLDDWESDKWDDLVVLAEKKGEELKFNVEKDAPERTGEYAKGFKLEKKLDGRKIRIVTKNKSKKKSLMHLLEFGHATRNGGRTRAFPHLINNEKVKNEEFYKEAMKIYES